MNDIQQAVPVTMTNDPTVSARHLHQWLNVGRDFATWIKDRIQEYGFIEGQDYSPILGNRSDGKPGKPRQDYDLSLDMAKELAMLERNDQGKAARQYFIQCEKRLRNAKPAKINPVSLRKYRTALLKDLSKHDNPIIRQDLQDNLAWVSDTLQTQTPDTTQLKPAQLRLGGVQ